ncbi:MAG: flagellar basal body P-ring formation chaperone FlgA [Pseudomonadota bacterium]
MTGGAGVGSDHCGVRHAGRLALVLSAVLLTAPLTAPALAQSATPVATVERGTLLAAADFETLPQAIPGALGMDDIVGKEAVRRLVPGRPLRASDVRDPLSVERGAEVTLVLAAGALEITAPGRALSGGATGDTIRVQSATSRTPITAIVTGPGRVSVQ